MNHVQLIQRAYVLSGKTPNEVVDNYCLLQKIEPNRRNYRQTVARLLGFDGYTPTEEESKSSTYWTVLEALGFELCLLEGDNAIAIIKRKDHERTNHSKHS